LAIDHSLGSKLRADGGQVDHDAGGVERDAEEPGQQHAAVVAR